MIRRNRNQVDWPLMCWSQRELDAWCTRQWLSAGELYISMGTSPERLVAEMGKPVRERGA